MRSLKLSFTRVVTVLAVSLLASGAGAQDRDQLLQDARSFREEANRVSAQRETDFRAADAATQTRLASEAEAENARLEGLVKTSTDTYSANDLRIQQLNAELRAKANELGLSEVFGLARQISADNTTEMAQSMINAQFAGQGSDRVEFFRDLSTATVNPTIADLEQLTFELQREITASGQVAKFSTNVVQPNGDLVNAEVVRIGPFTATTNGQFLSYLPNLARLSIMPRQLPPEFVATAAALEVASSGYLPAIVDPTRGVLTGLYVERPTWGERIHQGEEVGYIIIVVGSLGVLAFLVQLSYLIYARLGVSRQMRNLDKPRADNALGRVLLAFRSDAAHIEEDAEVAELRISEAVLKEIPALERFQAFLRLAVAAGPLLGLVGTVVGMIITFQSITESGSSDPKLMAAGIGQAMIATVLGLGIAVPLLFGGALLNSLSRSVVQVLDEQSAGLLADQLEKRRHA
jgi:biopolymer transport protein ExbB